MIPESDKLRPRPVWARYCQRILCEEWGVPLPDPTGDEIRDAFVVLGQPRLKMDPIHDEALRILEESLEAEGDEI